MTIGGVPFQRAEPDRALDNMIELRRRYTTLPQDMRAVVDRYFLTHAEPPNVLPPPLIEVSR